MKRICLLVLVLVILFPASSFGQDFDDLFGGDLWDEVEEVDSQASVDSLLVNEGIEVGGRYNFSVGASRTIVDSDFVPTQDSFTTDLGGHIFLDARPNPDFRVFAKTGIQYNLSGEEFGSAQGDLDVQLLELFSDFNYDNRIFFRAGKQNMGWSVGLFPNFRPADVMMTEPAGLPGEIPEDEEEEDANREGLVSLRAHMPVGSDNYYLYTIFDDAAGLDEIAVVPRMEHVIGNSEIGLGAYYQKNRDPRIMASATTSVADVDVFGEVVARIEKNDSGNSPLSWEATVGGSYAHTDDEGMFNLSGMAQYMYSGPRADNDRGTHQVGAAVSWNELLNSKFSASAMWQGNLSDESSLLLLTLSLPQISKIAPQFGVAKAYHPFIPDNTTVFAQITLGSGSF